MAYIKDQNRKVTHVNAGFARMFAQTSDNAIGSTSDKAIGSSTDKAIGGTTDSVIGKTDLWGEPESSKARDLQILSGQGEKRAD